MVGNPTLSLSSTPRSISEIAIPCTLCRTSTYSPPPVRPIYVTGMQTEKRDHACAPSIDLKGIMPVESRTAIDRIMPARSRCTTSASAA